MAGFSFNTNPASSSFASSSSFSSPFSFSSNPSSSPSLFGASAPSKPTFGTPSSSASSTSSLRFGSATSSAAPSPSFGFGTTSSPASGSPFSGSILFTSGSSFSGTTITTTSLFGSGLSSSSTTSSIFGASSASSATTATAVSSPFGSGLFGASPSVAASSSSSIAAASSPATSFPSLFGSLSSSSSISSSTTAQSTSSFTPSFSFLSSSSSNSCSFTSAPASSAPSFSFPSAATSGPSFSFSTTSAVVNSTGTVGSSGPAASTTSLFAGSSSSSSSGFSFGNVTASSGLASNVKAASTTATATATTGASSSASTTTPSFAAFGATSSSTTASTSTGLFSSFSSPATAAASTGTSSSFMGFLTSSKSVGTPTPASQPQSTAASSMFGDSASLTTTSTVTTTTAQTSSPLVVSSSSGTTASVSTAVATAPKLPSEITGKTVEEVSIQRPKSLEVVTREVIEKKKAELVATQVKIPGRSGAGGDKGAGPVEKEPAQTVPGSRLKSMLTAPPTRVPVYQKTLRKVADSTGYTVPYATGLDELVQAEPTAEELEAARKAQEALKQAKESRKLAEIVEKKKQVPAEKEKTEKEKFAHDMIWEEPVTEEPVIVALDSSPEGYQGGGDGKNVEGAPKEVPQVKESQGGSPKDGDKHAGGPHKGASQIKEVQASGLRNEARVQSAPSSSHGGGMDTIYVPRWNIEAGTRFLNPLVAEDFIDCAIPPAERGYQHGLGRDQLMSNMCMSTILMASSLNEVRRREREFVVKVDNFNRARGLLEKNQEKMEAEFARNKREVEEMKKKMLAKDAEINILQRESVDAKKRWDDAHRRSNAEIQRSKEKIQSLEAEKSKHEALAAEHTKAIEERDSKLATALGDLQLKDQDIMKTTSQLSALEAEKINLEEEKEVWGVEKASMQGLMDDVIAAQEAAQKDINWMMNEGVAGIFKRFWNEPKLGDQVAAIAATAHKDGRRAGIDEGFHIALNRKSIDECPLQDENTEAAYLQELWLFEEIKFQVLDVVGECAKLPDPVRELRNFFEESDRLGEEALKKAADAAAGVGSFGRRHDDDERSEELVDYDDESVGHGEEPADDDEGTSGPDE